MHLRDYLSYAGKRGFAWGENDCLMFVAGWVREVTGTDPGARWRGTYSTEAGAKAVLQLNGGMLALMDRQLVAHGWRRVKVTAGYHGDVVIAAPRGYAEHVAGVLVSPVRVAFHTKTGITIVPAPILKAWRRG